MTTAAPTGDRSADRYVSFSGIDFEGNMNAVLTHLRRYIDDPEKTNPFWERFKARLTASSGAAGSFYDRLLLLHSHVYYMVELFEDHEDEAALSALKKLEVECF